MADDNITHPPSAIHPPPSERAADETIKETIESIVIAFILAFVFRAYVVEAFVIPTGSMAPTLLGAHMPVTCDQCGYHFVSDWDPDYATQVGSQSVPRPLNARTREELHYACPMCRYDNVFKAPESPRSGDRILVHKYLYTVSEPQRWDVVVFKNPALPHENYIKRLIGLPHENLHLYEGNLYVQPLDPHSGAAGEWVIARKADRPEVQRAVFQPVYHSQYIPLDGGTGRTGAHRWTVPWSTSQAADWTLENARSYAYTGQGPSAIHFDFRAAILPIRMSQFSPGLYAYNQLHPISEHEPVEEVRIAATVEPKADAVTVSLSTTARLPGISGDRQQHRLRATVRSAGRVSLEAVHPESGETTPLTDATIDAFGPGEHREVELWYVDQQASVWIDGDRVLVHNFDAALSAIVNRPPLPHASTPNISVEIDAPAVLHDVEVDRDLFYQDRGVQTGDARGIVHRDNPTPLHLGADEFFCVGDNGPRSYDGRFWQDRDLNPWVRTQFLHERVARDEDPAGIVPREMMMGRAFFVYFPAPYSGGIVPLPNFGDMRFIH